MTKVAGRRAGRGFLVAAALAGGAPAAAAPITDRVAGGPGGDGHYLSCPTNNLGNPSAYMVGIGVRAGAWINAVRLFCAPVQGPSLHFAGSAPTPYVGGPDGGSVDRMCPANQYISWIKMGFTRDENRPKYLDYLQITCRSLPGTAAADTTICLDTGDGCWERHPNPGPYNGYGLAFQTAPCPVFHGVVSMGSRIDVRSGAFIDAIGMTCSVTGYVAR